MELEPGFKLSEAGPIPKDWEAVSLGDHLEFKNGISKAGHYFGHGSPIVNYMDVFGQPHLSLERLRGKVSVTKDEAKRFSVRKGDVFFTRTSETADDIGMSSVAMTERPNVVFSGFVLRGRPITGDFDSGYFGYTLRSHQARKQIEARATYTTRALTNGGILSLTNIAKPPLSEQRAIAGLLGDIDAWIAAAEAEAAKLAATKAAAMYALLAPTTRLPGFEGEWVRHRFGNVAQIRNRKVQTRGYDVARACVDLEQIEPREGRISRFIDVSNQLSIRYAFEPGDVLFGRLRAYLEKYWQADRRGVCSTEIWPLMLRGDALAAELLTWIVRTPDFIEAASMAFGTHMPRADWGYVCDQEFMLPPTLAEQRAIAGVLNDIDTALAAAREVVAKAKGVKAAAMDALLSGRIRLPL